MITALSIFALLMALVPAAMFLANLPLFCALKDQDERTEQDQSRSVASVSILVPARDEEAGIGACIDAALASEQVSIEVVVLDDDSSDRTASIVSEYSDRDDRVRLINGNTLPEGWNGKQHACKQLADAASHDRFVFIDADVRLRPDAMKLLIDYLETSDIGLLSAFPHQVTGTWLEKWLIPMMHFILLGYLPFSRMRTMADPSLAAGCGQLFLTTREAYVKAGTHESIKQSRHDGVKLPRAYRIAGIMTDVVDGSDLAECRMYRGAKETIRGALKNAVEGIANPKLIVVFSVLLLGCSILPIVALVFAVTDANRIAMIIAALAVLVSLIPRLTAAAAFRQSWFGAFCHVPATVIFIALQWIALINHLSGRRIAWRGRTES